MYDETQDKVNCKDNLKAYIILLKRRRQLTIYKYFAEKIAKRNWWKLNITKRMKSVTWTKETSVHTYTRWN